MASPSPVAKTIGLKPPFGKAIVEGGRGGLTPAGRSRLLVAMAMARGNRGWMTAVFAGALLWTVGSGCKAGSNGAAPSTAPQTCTRIGQTCEYSPNKLGSCVQKDNCTEDCLVCQSQH